MSELPFKRIEVADWLNPERIMTFERPTEESNLVVIKVRGDLPYAEPRAGFHLDAGTLRTVAEVMFGQPPFNREA